MWLVLLCLTPSFEIIATLALACSICLLRNLGLNPWGQIQRPISPTNTILTSLPMWRHCINCTNLFLSLPFPPCIHHPLKQMVVSSPTCLGWIPLKYVHSFLLSPFHLEPSLPPLDCCHSFLVGFTASGLCFHPSCTQSCFSKWLSLAGSQSESAFYRISLIKVSGHHWNHIASSWRIKYFYTYSPSSRIWNSFH